MTTPWQFIRVLAFLSIPEIVFNSGARAFQFPAYFNLHNYRLQEYKIQQRKFDITPDYENILYFTNPVRYGKYSPWAVIYAKYSPHVDQSESRKSARQ
jgi:hypothetical protein